MDRLRRITFEMHKLTRAQRRLIASAEIGQFADVEATLPGHHDPTRWLPRIEAIEHVWSRDSKRYEVMFGLGRSYQAQPAPVNILATGGVVTTPGDGYRYHTFVGGTDPHPGSDWGGAGRRRCDRSGQ